MLPENRTAKRKHSEEETYSIWSRAFCDSACSSSHLVLYPAGFISVVYSISFCCCGCGCGCCCWKLNWNGEGEEDGACVVAGAGVWNGFGGAGVWNGFDAAGVWNGFDAAGVWNGLDATGVWNGFDAAGEAKENAIAALRGGGIGSGDGGAELRQEDGRAGPRGCSWALAGPGGLGELLNPRKTKRVERETDAFAPLGDKTRSSQEPEQAAGKGGLWLWRGVFVRPLYL